MRMSWCSAVICGALMLVGAPRMADAQTCATLSTLRSPPGDRATEITFRNSARDLRRVFSIDAGGARKFVRDLPPGAAFKQSTFVGHSWVVTRDNGRCVLVVVAQPRAMVLDITRSCATGSIDASGACVDDENAPTAASGCKGGTLRGNTCVCPAGTSARNGVCQ